MNNANRNILNYLFSINNEFKHKVCVRHKMFQSLTRVVNQCSFLLFMYLLLNLLTLLKTVTYLLVINLKNTNSDLPTFCRRILCIQQLDLFLDRKSLEVMHTKKIYNESYELGAVLGVKPK